MKHPNNLFKLRKAAGLTQEDIANIWGVHRGDVSRIERGEHSISTVKRELLTKHFGWTASQILDPSDTRQVPVLGVVGEGGAVQLAKGISLMSDGSFKEPSASELSNCEQVDVPPGEYPVDLACVRIKGHSMHPVYKDGEYLFYRRLAHEEEQFINRDCIAVLENGRMMVGSVKAGRSYGHYDLDSYNQPPIENIGIKWAAPIEWVKKSL